MKTAYMIFKLFMAIFCLSLGIGLMIYVMFFSDYDTLERLVAYGSCFGWISGAHWWIEALDR